MSFRKFRRHRDRAAVTQPTDDRRQRRQNRRDVDQKILRVVEPNRIAFQMFSCAVPDNVLDPINCPVHRFHRLVPVYLTLDGRHLAKPFFRKKNNFNK